MTTKFTVVKVGWHGHFVSVIGVYDTRKQANAAVKHRKDTRSSCSLHVVSSPYHDMSVELMKEREGE